MDYRALAYQAVERLDDWIEENGWAGYDPFDIKGLPLTLYLQRRRDRWAFRNLFRRGLWASFELFPILTRRLFAVNKAVNAKGMGLLADGYLSLSKFTGDDDHRRKAQECLDWLNAHVCEGYAGHCWGYPFDWQSRVFIPAGTPSAVVTTTVGNAYWNFYKSTGEPHYLTICESICRFFLTDLNIDEIDQDRLCFSYTPVDNFHVNNANLFAAEFLIRVGTEAGNDEFVRQGIRAASYTVSEQNSDGSICYWGKDQDDACRIDHFHTGFEIRSLYSIWERTGEESIRDAAIRYYDFYLDNFFVDRTVPKMRPHATFPINIHSCAEALLLNSYLNQYRPDSREYVENVLLWTIQNMQTDSGWFIYRIWKVGGVKIRTAIPFMRWGQAWMLNALATVLCTMYQESASERSGRYM